MHCTCHALISKLCIRALQPCLACPAGCPMRSCRYSPCIANYIPPWMIALKSGDAQIPCSFTQTGRQWSWLPIRLSEAVQRLFDFLPLEVEACSRAMQPTVRERQRQVVCSQMRAQAAACQVRQHGHLASRSLLSLRHHGSMQARLPVRAGHLQGATLPA